MKAEYLQVSKYLPADYLLITKGKKSNYMEHLDQVTEVPVKRETDITGSLMWVLAKEIWSLV